MDLFFIFKKLKMIKDKLPIIKKYPTILILIKFQNGFDVDELLLQTNLYNCYIHLYDFRT